MGDFEKAWWEWHHGEAAERLSDPAHWTMVGKGLADETTRYQSYPALDDWIIMITFNSGRTYTLRGVPERLYYGLLAASSPGRYFNDHLKGRY
jgi:hypothetical protein